jgi:integrase
LLIGNADSVVLNVPFSKTDPFGRGRILQHFRQLECSTCDCIVRDLELWAVTSRDKLSGGRDAYVFELNGRPLIRDRMLVKILKLVARYCGIKDHSISLHSLRYGGATLLATAGLPKYVIEHFRGWSPDSKVFKTYAQLGAQSARTVSRAMSQAASAGLADARIGSCFFGRR